MLHQDKRLPNFCDSIHPQPWLDQRHGTTLRHQLPDREKPSEPDFPDARIRGHQPSSIPIKLIRTGIKLASLLPNDVQGKVDDALKEKGLSLDFSQINEENIEEIVESLRRLLRRYAPRNDFILSRRTPVS